MSDIWTARAQAYRVSDAHAEGEDLDQLVAWAAGARTALDVATGGGHVARRLREAGLEVVTCDPSPGMQPDVICHAEHLPFADGSFDVVTCRTAQHHFSDVRGAVREMGFDRWCRRLRAGEAAIAVGAPVTEPREGPGDAERIALGAPAGGAAVRAKVVKLNRSRNDGRGYDR